MILRITPADIKEKEFPLTYKGYEVAEVSAFLGIVREEMEKLLEENESLHEKMKEYKELEVTWNFIEQCIKLKTKRDKQSEE